MPHVLYLAYGEDGTLLYVGISHDFRRRQAQHLRAAVTDKYEWPLDVERWDVIEVGDRESALALERFCIKSLTPLHNKVHN